MEERRQIKISLKTAIIAILLFVIIIIVCAVISFKLVQKEKTEENTGTSEGINGTRNDYYYSVTNNYSNYRKVSCTYSDEYDIQYISLDKTEDLSSFEVCEYMNYLDYTEYCKKWNLEQKYNYEDYNYIMFSYYCKNEYNYYLKDENGTDNIKAELVGLEYNNNETVLYIWDGEISSTMEYISAAYVITIPTTKESNQVNYISCFNYSQYTALTTSIDKPIIYLYPKEETEVFVNLGYPEKITCSYPNYINSWNVIAKPNGDLIDLNNGRKLYSLYYESESVANFKVEEDGFIVKGTEVAKFLEEKLAILGLTERETEEFIIYWLPKLQENEYNYIRFAKTDEIDENMPLEINPNPDTIIRVLMTYKGLDHPIEIEEQELVTPERTGFVAVEWGGTEIN